MLYNSGLLGLFVDKEAMAMVTGCLLDENG
jgi:hypothetical protein